MHWRLALDHELIPSLSQVAAEACGFDCRCEPDLINGDLSVVVPTTITPDLKQAVRDAVLARAREHRPTLNDCHVILRKPQVKTYCSHLALAPQWGVRPFEVPSHLTTIDLPLSDLLDLRRAESELVHRCGKAHKVATFALGGVSTLSRLSMNEWESLALNPVHDGVAAADLVREKYHLLPGLNWRFPETKDTFLNWVQAIDSSGTILLFDTGTEGNAPRQIFKLLLERLPHCETKSELSFEIVGIVDGRNEHSVPNVTAGRSANGREFMMTVEYIPVSRVISEDFQSLVGYRKLAKQGCLSPLRDLGLVRLIDDEGKLIQITGTDNLSDVFRGYMTNAIGEADRSTKGHEQLTEEIERSVVAQILDQAKVAEWEELHNARAIGLLSDEQFSDVQRNLPKRYHAELAGYPRHVWSFADKMICINGERLYQVLRDVAREKATISFSNLSKRYHTVAGDRHSPHKTWSEPLAILNGRTAAAGLPPLSAVVIYGCEDHWKNADLGLPGNGFWATTGVPTCPFERREREATWQNILEAVYSADWPDQLPE